MERSASLSRDERLDTRKCYQKRYPPNTLKCVLIKEACRADPSLAVKREMKLDAT